MLTPVRLSHLGELWPLASSRTKGFDKNWSSIWNAFHCIALHNKFVYRGREKEREREREIEREREKEREGESSAYAQFIL